MFIKNVSLKSLTIGLRWAKMKGYPNNIKDWTNEQNSILQSVCKVWDNRQKNKHF